MGTGSTLGLVRQKLSTARSVTVLTGAGIPPTAACRLRGADGSWRHYRAEDLATPEAFARDPRLSGNGTTGAGNSSPPSGRTGTRKRWPRWSGGLSSSG